MYRIINIIKNGANIIFMDIKSIFKPNKLFINGFFARKNGKLITNHNWGDDINISFLQEISNLNIIVKNISFLFKFIPIKNYNCIGSIIGPYTDKLTIIWGSGIIKPDMPIPNGPLKVCSVRGPLTRQILLKHNIECPEKYGDPALLVSQYYKPKIQKKYEIGIIPHYSDEANEVLNNFCKEHPETTIIHMTGYKNWHEIPNKILSCKRIISSSLHGLIIADSYGIPNSWVKFSDKIGVNDNFKYWDYFASVGRECKEPIVIKTIKNIQDIIDNNIFEVAKNIDFRIIFETCPFKDNLKDYLIIRSDK